jgi:hypothetical protein
MEQLKKAERAGLIIHKHIKTCKLCKPIGNEFVPCNVEQCNCNGALVPAKVELCIEGKRLNKEWNRLYREAMEA